MVVVVCWAWRCRLDLLSVENANETDRAHVATSARLTEGWQTQGVGRRIAVLDLFYDAEGQSGE